MSSSEPTHGFVIDSSKKPAAEKRRRSSEPIPSPDDSNFEVHCRILATSMEDEKVEVDFYPGKDLLCVPFGSKQPHCVYYLEFASQVPEDVIPEKMYLKRGNGLYVRYEPVWKKMRI